MALTKEKVVEVVQTYGKNNKDTGSTEVQVALLTGQINNLTAHLKANPKDHVSQRGLMVLVGKRRRLLDYLAVNDRESYLKLIASLGLRK